MILNFVASYLNSLWRPGSIPKLKMTFNFSFQATPPGASLEVSLYLKNQRHDECPTQRHWHSSSRKKN